MIAIKNIRIKNKPIHTSNNYLKQFININIWLRPKTFLADGESESSKYFYRFLFKSMSKMLL